MTVASTEPIQKLLDSYVSWLRDRTSLRTASNSDWAEVTTPFLDRHNDSLQIYIRRDNGHFTLTDDGYVIQDLEISGCRLDTPKRQELLLMTARGFGVELAGDSLQVKATDSNFPQKKHALIQAMLAVNDLFYLAPSVIMSLFYEDVVRWLDEHEIRYAPSIKLPGKTGYDHHFDFLIPKSRTQPERILKAINRPNRETAEAFMFAWLDTREARPPEAQAYALLNDSEQKVPSGIVEALERYDVRAVLWSARETVRKQLAA